jgi:hypothetical protein
MTPIVDQLLPSPRNSNTPVSRFQRHTHTPHFSLGSSDTRTIRTSLMSWQSLKTCKVPLNLSCLYREETFLRVLGAVMQLRCNTCYFLPPFISSLFLLFIRKEWSSRQTFLSLPPGKEWHKILQNIEALCYFLSRSV